MDGRKFANYITYELLRLGIPKGKFYEDCGITATAMYGWKNGATPKRTTVATVENYFNTKFPDDDTIGIDEETNELKEALATREDLRILLRSAKNLPASSVYSLISQIEKERENAL